MASPFRFMRPMVSQAVRPGAFAFASRPFHISAARLAVRELKSADEFKQLVKTSDKAIVIDAFATWCGPCKAIAPMLEQWSEDSEFKGAEFVKFDVDELPDLSATLGVRAMPTFFIFKDGQKVEEVVGANPPALKGAVLKHSS